MSDWKRGFEIYPWCPCAPKCGTDRAYPELCSTCTLVVANFDGMEAAILEEKKRHDATFDKLTAANLQVDEFRKLYAAEKAERHKTIDKLAQSDRLLGEVLARHDQGHSPCNCLEIRQQTEKRNDVERLIEAERELAREVRCDCGVPGCNKLYDHRK